MNWRAFTAAATIGAAIWTVVYVGLGYVFATQIGQVATILSNFFGIVIAASIGIGCLIWLRKSWRTHVAKREAAAQA